MPAPTNTLLIEGSFEELVDELAHYIDNLRKDGAAVQPEIEGLIHDGKKEEALKKLVTASSVLNSAPEKEIIAAYNLLIHIVRQAPNPEMFLPRLCQNISAPMSSSPNNSTGIQLSCLSTIFNTIAPDNDARYHILIAILKVVGSSTSYEALRPQLADLDKWLAEWDMDEEDSRKLYLLISEVAKESGEADEAYQYLLRGLRTFSSDEASSQEARDLSVKALKTALTHPMHFDFQDLTSLDAIQALRKSDPVYFELLELFTSETLDDYNDFKDEHDGWVEEQGLDVEALNRKMRLLTLASLAAHEQSRSLPYNAISRALRIPQEDVELWVIDVIRAGLVEGKLSQLNQQFQVHRSTYRVFGDSQWREVAARLGLWRTSLLGVLDVIRAEKEGYAQQKEQELREIEAKVNGDGDRPPQRSNYRNRNPRLVEVNAD